MPVNNIDWHFCLLALFIALLPNNGRNSLNRVDVKQDYQIRTRSSSGKYKSSPGFTSNALYQASWLRGA